MKKIISILLVVLIGVYFLTLTASAATKATGLGNALTVLNSATSNTGLEKELSVSVGTVIKGALSLVGTIFLVLMIYAGITWMTAQGEESKVETSIKIIKAAIIGLFITLAAYAITYFVTSKLGG